MVKKLYLLQVFFVPPGPPGRAGAGFEEKNSIIARHG
jgi:hypothetical protein